MSRPKNSFAARRLLALVPILAILGTACEGVDIEFGSGTKGSGVALAETLDLDLSEVTEIGVNSIWDVTIEVGSGPSGIAIEVDDNLRDRVDIEVKNDRLILSLDGGNSRPDVGYKAVIIVNDLSELEMSGASNVTLFGQGIDLDRVELSGVATADLTDVSSTELDLEVSGAARLEISGTATVLGLDLEGVAEVLLSDLVVTTAEVDLSGASNGEVQASDKVTGSTSGVSTLTVDGQASVSVSTSGVSSVETR